MNIPEAQINTIVQNICNCVARKYDEEHRNLFLIGQTSTTEGQIRAAAGMLVENLLQTIFNAVNREIPEANIISMVGSSDYLSKEVHFQGNTYVFNTIQVDRHVWSHEHRIAFVENKTFLDACFYDRALADFRKIAQALAQHNIDPASVSYMVFAGQNAADVHTLETYTADFWNDTRLLTTSPQGLIPYICFFLKGKRSSARPLYKVKHELDIEAIESFIRKIISIL